MLPLQRTASRITPEMQRKAGGRTTMTDTVDEAAPWTYIGSNGGRGGMVTIGSEVGASDGSLELPLGEPLKSDATYA